MTGGFRPRIAGCLVALLAAGACGPAGAPTPVPNATPGSSLVPSATAAITAPPETGRVTDPSGTVSVVLPDGWAILEPDDPAFDTWFGPELATSIREGAISFVAIDEAGSEPTRPRYLLVAPVVIDEVGYLAAAARSFVDGAIAAGNAIPDVGEVTLPAGAARRIGVLAELQGADGTAFAARQVIYVVDAGGSPQVLAYQAVDVVAGEADAEAASIAESLEITALSGTVVDVPSFGCGSTIPLEDASGRTLALAATGQEHADPAAEVAYERCPPASGTHFDRILAARFHDPAEATVPQEWVHNLEHGQVVLLYRCDDGCAGDASALRLIARDAPPSPLCDVAESLIVTRFDAMPAPFAVVAWGQLRYLTSPVAAEVHAFIEAHGDRGPEAQCPAAAPAGSPSAAPAGSPAAP